jgi:hypothetical protein
LKWIFDAFEESQHPRARSGSGGGEFVSKGAGSAPRGTQGKMVTLYHGAPRDRAAQIDREGTIRQHKHGTDPKGVWLTRSRDLAAIYSREGHPDGGKVYSVKIPLSDLRSPYGRTAEEELGSKGTGAVYVPRDVKLRDGSGDSIGPTVFGAIYRAQRRQIEKKLREQAAARAAAGIGTKDK